MPLLAPNGERVSLPDRPADEPEVQGPVECVTAFVVYQLPDGRWQAADDLDVPLVPGRKPIPDEIYAGCSVITKDTIVHESAVVAAKLVIPNTAEAVVQRQLQLGQQAMQARENAMIQQKLEAGQRGGR